MLSKRERDKRIENPKAWVEVYHKDKYKTASFHQDEEPYFYFIHTRVNYLTASLWLHYRNSKVNDGRKGFVVLPDKPNWLVMVRGFRRMQDKKMKVLDYLEIRKKRAKNA